MNEIDERDERKEVRSWYHVTRLAIPVTEALWMKWIIEKKYHGRNG